MTNSAPINDPLSIPGLARRDFLKVGAGFSLALVLAGTVGCSGSAKAPVAGYAFLQPGDESIVVVYDARRYNAEQIRQMASVGEFTGEGMSLLRQLVVAD